MEKHVMLMAAALKPDQLEQVRNALPADWELRVKKNTDVTAEDIADVEVIMGNVKPELLKDAGKLKWVQLNSAGADPYYRPGVLPAGTLLTNSTGAYGISVSEGMIATLFSLFRHLQLYRDQQRDHRWNDLGPVRSVDGSVVLVIGLGDIGGDFARKMKALGCYVIGTRRSKLDKPDYLDEIHLNDELDSLLPRADVVAICVPGVEGTYKMFDAERFSKMKDDSVLINIGRGSVVDTDALCAALDSGKLGGACIDVTDPEPLPADHRLWNYDNVILTPHIAGKFHHPATLRIITSIMVENIGHYLSGEPLRNQVDLSTGYKK